MRLIANTRLYNPAAYGTALQGQEFDCPDDIAQELIAQGKARKADPPKILKETKVISPPEVGPVIPFRDVSMSDKKQEKVASEGNQVLSQSDAPKPRAADSGGRGKRLRSRRKRK